MSINRTFFVINVLPLIAVLILVYYLNTLQYTQLSDQATDVYREGLIQTRKTELKNLIQVAYGAIDEYYNNEHISQDEAQRRVKAMLNNMRFGKDGYYFAYDYSGVNQVLPGQQHLVGQNLIDLEDVNGVKIIQGLINNARNGGDYLHYIFNQPSKSGMVGKKLSYSEALDKWSWIVGTGVYIDDIDKQSSRLEQSLFQHIDNAARFTLLIGATAISVIFFLSTYIRFSEKRSADKKLRALNARIFQTQEEERKRVARELHDGISQSIASAKFSLETVQLKYTSGIDISHDIDTVMGVIRQVMGDVRGISHRLHPSVLEDHGLGAALVQLGREYQQRTKMQVNVKRLPVRNILTLEVKTALYRIAQEAMANIERHANATAVDMSIELEKKWLILEIRDNGQGFNYRDSENISDGIGLRNMKERLNYYRGELNVYSTARGTSVQARIPRTLFNYSNQPPAGGTEASNEVIT